MCGITGIFHFDREKPADIRLLEKMTGVISHRGPDGHGYYVSGNMCLGHRRLSIIDLATGNQPMFNDDQSIALVLNGEIYNYIELREELIRLGHHFRTTSDTEVIIRAYEEWGIECQSRLNGMWAFALWDEKRKHLFLSRDRIGEKPLNYTVFNNTLVFGSELKSLFEYGVPKKTRQELLEVYLVLTNIPGPDSFYENIFKLRPGHCIIVTTEGMKEHCYWDLPELDEKHMLTDKLAIYEEFYTLFKDSIRIRMRSDVPYGAFLSGGLDSSSIVAVMSQLSPHRVETFTIGFPHKDFDESSLAREVAEKFRTNHHPGTVHPTGLPEALEKLVFHFDEPFGDSSAIATWQVSNFAVERVKMVLTGDGGDELLSGYKSFSGIKFSNLYRKMPVLFQKSLPGVTKIIAKRTKGSIRYKLNRASSVFETANLPFYLRLANKQSYLPVSQIKELTNSITNKINIEDYYQKIISSIPYQDEFYKLMYLNFKYDLPDDYLVKVDRMSMANSLETRTPFLDYRLIEFMVKVDKKIKMQGWERKSILRNTIGQQLPKSLLSAPKKGFAVPLREWFKEGITSQMKLRKSKSLFDKGTIEKILTENNQGIRDNGNFIWTLMMLEAYLD